MNNKQRNEIRELIESEIAKTEEMIGTYKDQTGPVEPDNAIGRISRMDAINNKSVAEASLRQVVRKLRMLQEALGKVDTDEFGICIKCKQPIQAGRILRMPQSRLCVKCAQ